MKEAAFYLGLTVDAVRELVWAGKLPYFPDGRRMLLDSKNLDDFIDRNKLTFAYYVDMMICVVFLHLLAIMRNTSLLLRVPSAKPFPSTMADPEVCSRSTDSPCLAPGVKAFMAGFSIP